MSYDAGALRFMIQAAGRQAFETDMAAAQQAVEKTGRAASEAAPKVDAVGDATDRAGKKAKDAKAPLDEVGKTSKQVAGQSETLAQQIRRVEKELEAEGDASESLKQKLSRLKAEQAAQEQAAREQAAAAKELSQIMLIAGAATAAVVTLSVAKFAEFDEAMAQTSAATMASTEDQRILGEAALEAGADTAYSASEAANAQEELAKAGQSVADIVGGSLNGALALAAAGQLEVARSAEIMATTLTQFRLPAEQAAHVSDVLAAGAGKAQGSVEDMALALSYVGPVASGLKISLEETGGAIAYLASEGILGEKAGTALRGVLMSLTAPSAIAARTMGEYGIEIFDAQGNMKSLAEVSEILKRQLGGLTEAERSQALGRIFGNEQITAARILYSGGAKAIEEWTAAVDDSGYAAEQASMRQDNLAGDIEKLGGAFDTALIRTGAPANDMLREMVQIVTALVDIYGEMPAPVQTTAVVLGIATTAALLFGGAAVGIRARLIELQTELAKTNSSIRTTAIVGAAAGLALTGVITVVGILIAKQAEMNSATAEFADSLNESTGAVTSYTRELIAKKLADAGAFEQAQKAGVTQRELTDALYEGGDAYEAVIAKLREAHDATGGWDAGLGNTVNTVKDMNVQLTDAKTRHQDLEAATDEAKDSSKSAAEAYMDEAGSLQDVNDELRALIDSLFEVNGTNRDAVSANIQFQDALRAADDQIAKVREGAEGYAKTLDITTDAGSRNTDVLLGIAKAGEDAATAQYEVDGSAEQLRSTLEATHQAVMDRARAFGATEEEARLLADTIAGIPSDKAFTVIAQTATAQGQIDDFVYRNADRTIALRIAAGPGGQGGITQADGGKVEFYANGGRSENHIAQFARAGTYRVWAEDETGGEWYLPNSEAKRGRSLAIAEQMLGEWGYAMVPVGAGRYAQGSPVTPTQAAAPGSPAGMPPIHIDASGLTVAEARSLIQEELRKYFA